MNEQGLGPVGFPERRRSKEERTLDAYRALGYTLLTWEGDRDLSRFDLHPRYWDYLLVVDETDNFFWNYLFNEPDDLLRFQFKRFLHPIALKLDGNALVSFTCGLTL